LTGPGAVLALSVLLGLAGGAVAWRMLAHVFEAPLFQRENVRGIEVPVAAGVVLPLVAIGAAAVLVVLRAATDVEVPLVALVSSVLAAGGFALLGLLDDLAGDRAAQGFAGHLAALRHRRLTTGSVKLFGGAALALVVVAPTTGDRPGLLLADAALVALSANLANLLDRAPGRLGKAAVVAAVPVAVAAGVDARLAGPVVVLGALVTLLVHDLRERLMLGDTGANVVGGVLALAAVVTLAPVTRVAMLVVVAVLNVLSEVVSFSRVIEATPALRWFDRLGRRRATD
jgi:UDP-GlcNAc:undecaprenyl-phosphate/decaprenyl-phosphate GlcNAc-1-phosphate transferase